MAIRDDLITAIGNRIAPYSNFRITSEYPTSPDGVTLYRKNLRTFYADQAEPAFVEIFSTLDNAVLDKTETIVNVYMSHDAKTEPGNITATINAAMLAKNNISAVASTVDVTSQIDADIITYTLEYNFTTV
jgi:hypothetical protein